MSKKNTAIHVVFTLVSLLVSIAVTALTQAIVAASNNGQVNYSAGVITFASVFTGALLLNILHLLLRNPAVAPFEPLLVAEVPQVQAVVQKAVQDELAKVNGGVTTAK